MDAINTTNPFSLAESQCKFLLSLFIYRTAINVKAADTVFWRGLIGYSNSGYICYSHASIVLDFAHAFLPSFIRNKVTTVGAGYPLV